MSCKGSCPSARMLSGAALQAWLDLEGHCLINGLVSWAVGKSDLFKLYFSAVLSQQQKTDWHKYCPPFFFISHQPRLSHGWAPSLKGGLWPGPHHSHPGAAQAGDVDKLRQPSLEPPARAGRGRRDGAVTQFPGKGRFWHLPPAPRPRGSEQNHLRCSQVGNTLGPLRSRSLAVLHLSTAQCRCVHPAGGSCYLPTPIHQHAHFLSGNVSADVCEICL
jgi:hypothetical protein